MTVPYNAPGGQLEQMLLSNQFEDDFDKVREEVDGLRPMSADGLIRHFVGPIGAEPERHPELAKPVRFDRQPLRKGAAQDAR